MVRRLWWWTWRRLCDNYGAVGLSGVWFATFVPSFWCSIVMCRKDMEECGRHDRAHTTTDEVAGKRQRGGCQIDVQGGVGMGSGTKRTEGTTTRQSTRRSSKACGWSEVGLHD